MNSPPIASELRVGLILRPHFSLTSVSCIVDALRLANDEAGRSHRVRCSWELLAMDRSPMTCSSGISLNPTCTFDDAPDFDALVVVAGRIEKEPPMDARTLAYLHAANHAGKIIAGIGTGVLALIHAGFLDGRTCVVHWYRYRDFADRFPQVRFRSDRVMVADGNYVTCAGSLTAAQFAVWLVQRHFGDAIAHKCADLLLLNRSEVQPHPPAPMLFASERIRRTLLILEETLHRPLSIRSIADRVGVSPRHLQRAFKEEVGISLQTYCRTLRLQYGLWRILFGGESIAQAAQECGFSDASHFSRVCQQVHGKRPNAITREEFAVALDALGHRAARRGSPLAAPG